MLNIEFGVKKHDLLKYQELEQLIVLLSTQMTKFVNHFDKNCDFLGFYSRSFIFDDLFS